MGCVVVTWSQRRSTWPPIRSVSAGAAPLYAWWHTSGAFDRCSGPDALAALLYGPTIDQPACWFVLSFSYSQCVPQASQR